MLEFCIKALSSVKGLQPSDKYALITDNFSRSVAVDFPILLYSALGQTYSAAVYLKVHMHEIFIVCF